MCVCVCVCVCVYVCLCACVFALGIEYPTMVDNKIIMQIRFIIKYSLVGTILDTKPRRYKRKWTSKFCYKISCERTHWKNSIFQIPYANLKKKKTKTLKRTAKTLE